MNETSVTNEIHVYFVFFKILMDSFRCLPTFFFYIRSSVSANNMINNLLCN